MNARIKVPVVAFIPSDFELERDAIGLALLGYPLPDDLQRDDFFASQHRIVFDAIRELGNAANLATVYAYLRDVKAQPYHQPRYERDATGLRRSGAPAMSSVELFEMMDAADHAVTMGWAVDFPRLTELRRRRELLAAMRRATVLLEHDGDWCEAAEILKGAM